MRLDILKLIVLLLITVSCIEPEKIEELSSNDNKGESGILSEKVDSSGVAAKNFAQINNTYSSLTGISMGDEDINSEYALIKTQLPSTSKPESLNGFNQIASTRLAFAYCDKFIDKRSDLLSLNNNDALKNLIEGFIDVDLSKPEHSNMYSHLQSIMNDDDSLINDGNATSKKRKLLKLSCTAVLASSYVTLI